MSLQMSPLQYAFSGPLELLIALLVLLVLILLPVYLVYRDAKKRGMNAAFWAVLVGILLLIGLLPGLAAVLYYLWTRDDVIEDETQRTASEGSNRQSA